MKKIEWNRFPSEEQPIAFNMMTGWFGIPKLGYVCKSGSWGKEALWTFMPENDARFISFDDAQHILQSSATTIHMTRLYRMVTVRTEWSRK